MQVRTQTHLKALRDALIYRLRELGTEIDAAGAQARGNALAGAAEVVGRQDEAATWQASTVGAAEERRDLAEIAHIQAALRRLDEGVYGDCEACGEPIAWQRLLVQPAAQRCASCQSSFEGRTRAHPSP